MDVDLKKIRELRKQRGIKQEEMAHLLGYKTQTGYSYLETGRSPMQAGHLGVIARRLGVTVDSLYLECDTAL